MAEVFLAQVTVAEGLSKRVVIKKIRKELADQPEFTRMFVEKMMTYATGRGMEYTDMPTIRAITRDAAKDQNRFSSIVMAVVKSDQFQMRVKGDDASRNTTN